MTASTNPNLDPLDPGGSQPPHLVALDPDSPRPVWKPKLWTARTLMDTEFPAPRWAVPGVLCEGLSLLAGPPKVGKSWLSLDLAIAVAGGGKAFGTIPVRPGPVLYLALEDTPRRLKERMGKLLGDDKPPPGLDIATDWPTLPAGGDVAIASWLDAHPDARMVVLDVFARIRGPVPPGMSAYDADYAAVTRAKRIADHYAVALVVLHHVRKAGSEDFLQEVSGTNGIAGAADATLVLKRARGQADGTLYVTGRDVAEAEYPLSYDKATGHWTKLQGQASDYEVSDTRASILRWLREHPGATPKQITAGTGLNYDTTRRTAARMAGDGQLARDSAGHYTVPDTTTADDPAGGTAELPLGGVPPVPPVPAPSDNPLTSTDIPTRWDSTTPTVPTASAAETREDNR